eukprot:7066402-Lingulodinium_polyedra.AAC.1
MAAPAVVGAAWAPRAAAPAAAPAGTDVPLPSAGPAEVHVLRVREEPLQRARLVPGRVQRQ